MEDDFFSGKAFPEIGYQQRTVMDMDDVRIDFFQESGDLFFVILREGVEPAVDGPFEPTQRNPEILDPAALLLSRKFRISRGKDYRSIFFQLPGGLFNPEFGGPAPDGRNRVKLRTD